MARLLELVPVLFVFALIIGGFVVLVEWRVRAGNKRLIEENDRLRKENVELKDGENERLSGLETDIAALHAMADDIMRVIAERPNPLDLSGPYQPITDIIAIKRPTRK